MAVLTGITALQMTLVAVGNVTDFETNRAFVRHVLAMDTTFTSPGVMWRAITAPGLVDAAYLAIIAWEMLTALILLISLAAWFRTGQGGSARCLAVIGWLMQVVLFGCGFIVIGGEWFQMWQSSSWNGLEPAFRNLVIASIGLILAYLRRPAASP
ncbi:putative small integral membrane protein [Amycolatopsis sulphurea]|uniref:Putative small integral membrane protein n=1 Tax=Amycolatopsis sulphurea TaxID=76022 RepID=A0A2A9FJP8_9PSEU|nr:putative small integral membrane protein [Amycolatopsis sulphurea]